MPVGQLRFIVPERSRLSDRAAQQAYLTGFDPIPSLCRARFTELGDLIVERDGFDSTKLNLPWNVDGHGELLLTTGTLLQRDRPYLLPLELARGKAYQVRNQIADWQQQGIELPSDAAAKLTSATKHFTDAAVRQHEPLVAAMFAQDSLTDLLEAADLATRSFVEQSLTLRHRSVERLPIAYGCALGRRPVETGMAKVTAAACNTAIVPLGWKQVVPLEDEYHWDEFGTQLSWCASQGMNTCAGPLLRLDDRGFPAWLEPWKDDIDAIAAFAAEYVAKVVQQFRGRVSFWNCASFSYRPHQLGLRDEDKLRILARAVETVRRCDPDTPVLVSFDQPWGEYLRKVPLAYAPIHIADHLVRSGLPIAALGMEIETSYYPDGSYYRDPLELGKLVDQWSMLGMPLYVFLAAPSDGGDDPMAETRNSVVTGGPAGGWNAAAQAAWIRANVPMLFAKNSVQGIGWLQYRDDEPHELPHAGLLDSKGLVKPALRELSALRREHVL